MLPLQWLQSMRVSYSPFSKSDNNLNLYPKRTIASTAKELIRKSSLLKIFDLKGTASKRWVFVLIDDFWEAGAFLVSIFCRFRIQCSRSYTRWSLTFTKWRYSFDNVVRYSRWTSPRWLVPTRIQKVAQNRIFAQTVSKFVSIKFRTNCPIITDNVTIPCWHETCGWIQVALKAICKPVCLLKRMHKYMKTGLRGSTKRSRSHQTHLLCLNSCLSAWGGWSKYFCFILSGLNKQCMVPRRTSCTTIWKALSTRWLSPSEP